jgi:ComF family protein
MAVDAEIGFHDRAGLANALRDALAGVVDLLLPVRCPACMAPVAGTGLCGACWGGVDFIAQPYCERLGTPFPYDPGEAVVSPAALADPPDYQRARAVARYEGPARSLVHALKFRDRMEIADLLARQMARTGRELLEDCNVIVPVPLHRRRLFARRFNQAALLAERIAAFAQKDYAAEALVRSRPTRHQIGLSASERRRNVSGAFRVPSHMRPLIEGRRVLIVDDVVTTGATVDACARACRRVAAANVDVLAFARVVAAV